MRRCKRAEAPYTSLGAQFPLRSLVQALVVAEHLNFRHTANALGVTQSSVSTRIKALEETMGIVLFRAASSWC
ncbi:helix-turn-helix domain-containing protein [Gluconobacter thailandicus]|uniref:helix-turn-helix domain-containing protein n=1 Tax=Gluconobacter thailandicus TaxID=257438 RepID=UPI002D76C2CC|nr:LysR family transcriptional regulator [Gluconobacter thailandicus]